MNEPQGNPLLQGIARALMNPVVRDQAQTAVTLGQRMGDMLMAPAQAWKRMVDSGYQPSGQPDDPARDQMAADSFDVSSMVPVAGIAAASVRTGASLGSGGGVLRGYHGTSNAGRMGRPMAEEMWMTADRSPGSQELASHYAMASDGNAAPTQAVVPVNARFANPLEIDAGGADAFRANIPFEGKRYGSEDLADLARSRGHDGLVLRNVSDRLDDVHQPTDTMAALLRGTVSDDYGNLLFSNSSRASAPGIAVSAMDEAKGIRAYHGSPHDFDKFDLSKIGTGEGAQAYGHGLYFADSEGVAKWYRDGLTPASLTYEGKAVTRIPTQEFEALPIERRQALNWLRRQTKMEDVPVNMEIDNLPEAIKREVKTLIDEGKVAPPPPGRMYEVRINADPNDFLDWDKPLSQQSEKVRSVVGPDAHNLTGAQFYDLLVQEHPGSYRDARPAIGSALAEKAGIPGIKYLDAGSRGAGDGSRNYVLFRDDIIDIVRKYGMAAAVSMFGADAVMQSQMGEALQK